MSQHDLGPAESVCPDCLRPIAGRLVRRGEEVLLEKQCPEHGAFSATIWRGRPDFASWHRDKLPYGGGPRRPVERGCPSDCGLCGAHRQRTCTALVEITSRCNLGCPVCFATSASQGADLDLPTLEGMLSHIIEQTGGCNLQFSGGEPTLHPELPAIIALARDRGFTFIQLNSNGLKLAEDRSLAERLRDHGLSSVFLQFDGVDDQTYQTLRGRALFAEKCRAIDHLAAAGLGVVLVPTVLRGVNSDQLWEMVRFALGRMPAVRGIHFQPISYFGRFPERFTPDHFTLPEIIQALAHQSQGRLRLEDFHPPSCEHALCSFSAKYLVEESGRLVRLGGASCDCSPQSAEQGARTAIAATARQWAAALPLATFPLAPPVDDLDHFLNRAASRTFAISAMVFQDCWNLNLERLRGCCIHVAQEDGRLIPFCSYNLTSRHGRPLHRRLPASAIPKTTVDRLVARRLSLPSPLTRRDLEEAQLIALRELVDHAKEHSTFYRRHLAGIDSRNLQSRADLARLPLLTTQQVIEHGQGLLAASQAEVARMVSLQTSGSTGPAKRIAYSREDLAATADFFRSGMANLVGQKDRVLVLLPYELPDSVGQLLISALKDGGIAATGHWPPQLGQRQTAAVIDKLRPTCLVGLPQHLLALAEQIGKTGIATMLLCSDYAAPALRRRIEEASGCTTFLHYGSTESGLGGGVECAIHQGCHLRESELLVEIVDPYSGRVLPDAELGEVVLTTLGRRAMPLLRYRSGDAARLVRSPCRCGGITARLSDIRGRLRGCPLPGGETLFSQDLDDLLFTVAGLLDYRVFLDCQGINRLHGEFVFGPAGVDSLPQLRPLLTQQPAIARAMATGSLEIGGLRQVSGFTPNHTIKRTIIDLRRSGES